MSRESQYVDKYLQGNLTEPVYTPGTFLAYTLRGNAKRYSAGYLRALVAACERRVAEGTAEACASARGRPAYRAVSR